MQPLPVYVSANPLANIMTLDAVDTEYVTRFDVHIDNEVI